MKARYLVESDPFFRNTWHTMFRHYTWIGAWLRCRRMGRRYPGDFRIRKDRS